MKDDNFIINVKIGGFRLPLNIPRKNEELYRKAEKLVNKILLEYQQKYNQRPQEEILSIVAYQLAVALSKQEFTEDTSPIVDKIEELDRELSKILFDLK